MKKMLDCIKKPHIETDISMSAKMYKDDKNSQAIMSSSYSDSFDIKLICIVGVVAAMILICKICCMMSKHRC
ncbi:MAG: hypothetical protein UH851_01590 [Clostridia bacterium]|nr:hypothetical protein [Clostridia bacterium]MEE1115533.1 hypothetical protein [Clostridia bacterium]